MYQFACAHDASVYRKTDKGQQVDGGEANIHSDICWIAPLKRQLNCGSRQSSVISIKLHKTHFHQRDREQEQTKRCKRIQTAC